MYLSADKIHDGKKWLPSGTIIQIDEQGFVVDLLAAQQIGSQNVQYFEGMLCPGFVNAHCHLELSHMQGIVPQNTGLVGFLLEVIQGRSNFSDTQKLKAQTDAYEQMCQNGIVAVGDIANTTDTLPLRIKEQMHFYTFVESIGFVPERAEQSLAYAQKVWDAFASQNTQNVSLQQSVVPHAPYSVSEKLFALIAAHQSGKTISVHNQESAAENQFYQNATGSFVDFLAQIGLDTKSFLPSGKSSLMTYTQVFDSRQTMLFVHNTFSNKADIEYAQTKFENNFWCLCPNANLYIENRLPDIEMLLQQNAQICLGTDSLASNHQLCIMAEMLTIKQHFPQINWENLLRWATYNGASALQMDKQIGSIEIGKKPGLNWISTEYQIKKIA